MGLSGHRSAESGTRREHGQATPEERRPGGGTRCPPDSTADRKRIAGPWGHALSTAASAPVTPVTASVELANACRAKQECAQTRGGPLDLVQCDSAERFASAAASA